MFTLNNLSGFGAFTPASVPAGSYIRSIQTFEITIGTSATSNTATITSVTTGNSVIFFNGFTTTNSGTTIREYAARVELTNGTTVTAYRDTSSATHTVTARGTVVEFESAAISSIQHGTVTVGASNTGGTATISSVTTSRSVLFYLGVTNTTSTTSSNVVHCRIDLTDATTVTATRNTSTSAVLTVGYIVVEFASGITQSVQPRSVTLTSNGTSSTDTITSVTTGNTMLIYNGVTSGNTTLANFMYNLQLTSATQVTLARTGTSTSTRTINYTAVEFASGMISTVQRGTTAISSVTSADTTITSVNTSKALCNATNFSTDATNTHERYATAKLLNATTVRAEKNTAGSTDSTMGWEVIEFV